MSGNGHGGDHARRIVETHEDMRAFRRMLADEIREEKRRMRARMKAGRELLEAFEEPGKEE